MYHINDVLPDTEVLYKNRITSDERNTAYFLVYSTKDGLTVKYSHVSRHVITAVPPDLLPPKRFCPIGYFGLQVGEDISFPMASSLVTLSRTVVPNLGPPDVLGLQLPEILVSRGGGKGFWEL